MFKFSMAVYPFVSLFIQLILITHTYVRCGSGKQLDCPGGTSHGILCCELDFVATNGGNQTNE